MGADSASSCARIRSTGSEVLAIALYVTAKDWGFVEHLHDTTPGAVASACGGKDTNVNNPPHPAHARGDEFEKSQPDTTGIKPVDTEVTQEHRQDQGCHRVLGRKESRNLSCPVFRRRSFMTNGGVRRDLSIKSYLSKRR